MLAMRPSATAMERIQLSQAGAAGISEEANRSSPKPSRNRTIAVRPTDFHMTLRKGGENIWVKDLNASESISEDFRKSVPTQTLRTESFRHHLSLDALRNVAGLEAMMSVGAVTALERAFQLARSGASFRNPRKSSKRFKREGYSDGQMQGPVLRRQPGDLIKAARERGASGKSGRRPSGRPCWRRSRGTSPIS